jgi:hypothetical protein
MKPRRHRARSARPSFFSRAANRAHLARYSSFWGCAGAWGGVQGLPTGVRAGDKISEACTCRSARPRATTPLQKFCAELERNHTQAEDIEAGSINGARWPRNSEGQSARVVGAEIRRQHTQSSKKGVTRWAGKNLSKGPPSALCELCGAHPLHDKQ